VTTLSNLEASLAYRAEDFQVSGTAYLNWVRDPVELSGRPSVGLPTTLRNGAGADVKGFELEARRTFGDHSLFLNYALSSAREPETGRRLADVPLHMATLGGTFLVAGDVAVSPSVIVRGKRRRSFEDVREPMAGYALVNVAVRRTALSKKLEVRAVLNNVLDNAYEHPAPYYGVPGDYPRPGRNFFIDAKYRF
jgi:outer membrane receptor protein involved in Fe transport